MRALGTEKSLGLRLGLCAPRTAGVAEIQEGLLWFFSVVLWEVWEWGVLPALFSVCEAGARNPSDSPTRPV